MSVRIEGVSFAFGATRVLDDVSVAIEPGALVGFLGPNGAGKTTLLRLIAGSLAATAGRVWIGGTEAAAVSRREMARRLAVVPQETQLAFDYSVLEIALMGRYPHLGAFEVEGPGDLAVARSALEMTGTAHLADRAFATLSGGEKQRVIIASALAQLSDPPESASAAGGLVARPNTILLLDEPTASLDLRYQLEVASVLHRLHDRGLTIVLSTHDLRFAASLCTEVVLLSHGSVLAQGPPDVVLTAESIGTLYDIDRALAAPLVPA